MLEQAEPSCFPHQRNGRRLGGRGSRPAILNAEREGKVLTYLMAVLLGQGVFLFALSLSLTDEGREGSAGDLKFALHLQHSGTKA